ncbi:ThuA domain-containing protein [Salinibacterium sp. G-O1]|uniref:ThuA domain-containing protein n=1 Tax=Salinibacterium sp. G-O1 TaxID=3046208 RepID=UPI0024BB94F1|nr:ThuA domain-containing protein [Salinibacterium sp. G-O1]MDJ0334069.1 ThuA domain-containing protein [Salinibacterium sp. G-O1]
MRALIASGTGRYADPWHPFPRTSPILAAALEDRGFIVQIDDDVDHAMRSLDDVDLLVVNAGDPWRNDPGSQPPATSIEGLRAALERGIGVLAMHCAVASLRDYPEWAPAIGAMWVPTLSSHPPADDAHVQGLTMPDGTPVAGFELFDERYCGLQFLGRSVVVAEHEGLVATEPTAWVRHFDASRVAVDVLGHDERAYASPGHLALIGQLASWAAQPR